MYTPKRASEVPDSLASGTPTPASVSAPVIQASVTLRPRPCRAYEPVFAAYSRGTRNILPKPNVPDFSHKRQIHCPRVDQPLYLPPYRPVEPLHIDVCHRERVLPLRRLLPRRLQPLFVALSPAALSTLVASRSVVSALRAGPGSGP